MSETWERFRSAVWLADHFRELATRKGLSDAARLDCLQRHRVWKDESQVRFDEHVAVQEGQRAG